MVPLWSDNPRGISLPLLRLLRLRLSANNPLLTCWFPYSKGKPLYACQNNFFVFSDAQLERWIRLIICNEWLWNVAVNIPIDFMCQILILVKLFNFCLVFIQFNKQLLGFMRCFEAHVANFYFDHNFGPLGSIINFTKNVPILTKLDGK